MNIGIWKPNVKGLVLLVDSLFLGHDEMINIFLQEMLLLVCSDITAMEDPPRPPMDSARSLEMSGYMPCRGDFDVVISSIFSFGMKLLILGFCLNRGAVPQMIMFVLGQPV